MSTKIKHIISAVVFTLICMGLIIMFTSFFVTNDVLARLNVEGIRYEDDLDVILTGPSTLIDYYFPYQAWNDYGITSYNYSGPGLRSSLSREYLEDIRSTHRPDLYVVELSTMDLWDDSEVDEGGLRNWSDSLFFLNPYRIEGLKDYLDHHSYDIREAVSYYIPLIKYHTNYNALSEEYHWNFVFDRDSVRGLTKGYYGLETHTASALPDLTEERADRDLIQTHYLNEILDYCDKYDLTVLFLVTPHPRDHEACTVFNTWGDMITERGYDYLDMNRYYDEIGIDAESDFANYGHVNHIGAMKCTAFLAEYFTRHYDLTDHRGDPDYSAWSEEYDAYSSNFDNWTYVTNSELERHRSDRRLAEELKNCDDFDSWYYRLINTDMDVLITVNGLNEMPHPDSVAYDHMVDHLQIDPYSENGTVAAYSGAECLFTPGTAEECELDLGDAGFVVSCKMSASEGTDISYTFGVDDIHFHGPSGPGINIVVFDRYYYTVIDAVTISVDDTGSVILSRVEQDGSL